MSISLLVVCTIRLASGDVVQALGHEVKEINQEKSIVVFDSLNIAKTMRMNDCLYVDGGSKLEATYMQQIGPAIEKLNNKQGSKVP